MPAVRHNHDTQVTLPSVVIKLSDDLCDIYKVDRQRPQEVEWPPNQPSSIVNLALIHYKGARTHQELFEISKRCKEGAAHVDDITASHSNVTKDFHKIFKPENDNEVPKRILVEGAPGIGKTVLAREIAYQWANGEILKEYKLVFVSYLRDPKLHKVKSINEMLKLFTSDNTPDLQKYVSESRGRNVAFVFDGFDEYPVALQKHSFITELIKGVGYGRKFIHSTIIVTSRPTATLFLHGIVDRRIEILGFPKEERDKYVSSSLGNSLVKKQKFDKYLIQHPIINNLCYIPLHLAILMYLFQQDSLPETLTEMNKYFIINTIYRYMERNKLSPPDAVKELKKLPADIVEFVYKLSHLAFKGLQNNQLIFTHDEIREISPKLDHIPGAINGFGLLQAVQHYLKGGGAGRTMSVNFLHFTMQEYLAALHVSRCSYEEQSRLMRNTFWANKFSFMWMMYIGIVGIKSDIFTSFITFDPDSDFSDVGRYIERGNIFNDKRKCLHLFQCYMEAKSDAEMPKEISYIFTDGKIVLNDITLLPHHISSLIFFMSASSMQQWTILEMSNCNLGDIGMNSLLEHVIKNDNLSTLEYVDLSENNSSPWGVYCTVIRHCCVNSLALCGDEEMEYYIKEITDSLQKNTKLQSLSLYKIGQIGLWSIKDVLANNTTLKELNMSWISKGIPIIHRKVTHNELTNTSLGSNSHERMADININILYDGDYECSSEAVNMSNKDIDDDAVCLIAFGLYNNTTVKKLDLSQNDICFNGMKRLSECIKCTIPLEYVDLSGNHSSPWGVYCTIIRHCCVNNLTLCGDKGMKEYVKEITDSLQTNTTLKSLVLCSSKSNRGRYKDMVVGENSNRLPESNLVINRQLSFGTQVNDDDDNIILSSNNGIVNVNILYDDTYGECLPETISLSHNDINDDTACLISFGLYNNTTVKKFDLSCNKITDHGVVIISDWLKYNSTLKELNLSQNFISAEGMSNLSESITHTIPLEYVDLSGNLSSPWGVYCAIIKHCSVNSLTLCGDEEMDEHVKKITDSLQTNVVLQSLTMCNIGQIGLQHIKYVLGNNATLKELNMSWKSKGIPIIHRKFTQNELNNTRLCSNSHEGVVNINILYDGDHKCPPKAVNMSNKGIDDDAVCLIAFGLYNNTTVNELDLSHNKISFNGMKNLSESITHAIPLEYVDLSGNSSSPWGVYCAIIRHCCVNSLTLCGDKGIERYVKEVTDCLQTNISLQSLTVCKMGRIGLQSIKDVLGNYVIVKELNMSWKTKGTPIIHGKKHKLIHNDIRLSLKCSHEHIVDINIMYDGDHKCSREAVNMSNKDIDDDAVHLISFGLYNTTTVKKLDLSHNKISFDGMKRLSECINTIPLEYVDLSGNYSSPWGVYCAIIRHCCVNSLTLCGDKGMKGSIKEITDSLQTNLVLQSLTLCKIGQTGLQSINYILGNNTTLKELNLSWKSKGTPIIHKRLARNKLNNVRSSSNSHEGAVDINILYDGHHECSSEAVNFTHKGVNNDAACLIAFGLYNNRAVLIVDLSYNNIRDDGAVLISKCLKYNNTLKKLNLSHNFIEVNGMSYLSECITRSIPLEYVDLSGNDSSPWGVYCAVIRKSCVSNLTLCGDAGIIDYDKDIMDSLQTNATLESLTVCASKSNRCKDMTVGVNNIKRPQNVLVIDGKLSFNALVTNDQNVNSNGRMVSVRILYDGDYDCECSPETITLTNRYINDDTVFLISFGLYNNKSVQKLDLSCNEITDDGAMAIGHSLKTNNTLRELNLSDNWISSDGAKVVAKALLVNRSLLQLDISQNPICDDGVKYISDSLKHNDTLLELHLSRSRITNKGLKFIVEAIQMNKMLQKLDLSHNHLKCFCCQSCNLLPKYCYYCLIQRSKTCSQIMF